MPSPAGPPGYEPPSSAQLLRSTLLALAVAGVILVAFVLPSEYGVDPTGIGTALGLTRMGEIKAQLAAEAAEEDEAAAKEAMTGAPATGSTSAGDRAPVGIAAAGNASTPESADAHSNEWRDRTAVVLAPDEAAEIKLTMKAGDEAEYQWVAEGGGLNFNAHGHGGGQSVTYGKGRGARNGEGRLAATFDGHHGWFWRNRSPGTVSLTLRTRGGYSEVTRTR
ncbi:transmembrane anchor protein [bacterium]|nr:transmembrane anchor protein [bacterium]